MDNIASVYCISALLSSRSEKDWAVAPLDCALRADRVGVIIFVISPQAEFLCNGYSIEVCDDDRYRIWHNLSWRQELEEGDGPVDA